MAAPNGRWAAMSLARSAAQPTYQPAAEPGFFIAGVATGAGRPRRSVPAPSPRSCKCSRAGFNGRSASRDGQAALVVADARTGEDCVAGDVQQSAALLNGGQRHADRAVGGDRPVGLVARRVDHDRRCTSANTLATRTESRTSSECQATPEAIPGREANVTAVLCPAAVACRTSSAPRKPLPPMIKTVTDRHGSERRIQGPGTFLAAWACGPPPGGLPAQARRRAAV